MLFLSSYDAFRRLLLRNSLDFLSTVLLLLSLSLLKKGCHSAFPYEFFDLGLHVPSVVRQVARFHERAIELFVQINPGLLVIPKFCHEFLLFPEFGFDGLLVFMDLVDFLNGARGTWFCSLREAMV